MWWKAALVIFVSLFAAWVILVLILLVARPDRGSLREGTRVLSDALRLIRRLAGDRTIPRSARWPIWVLIAYLASPIDLVPDFVPVVGYADDLIIAALVLRHLVHRAGPEKVREHWPGSPDGLAALGRLLRIDSISN